MSNMLFELKAAALLHTLPPETAEQILSGTQLQAALSILKNWDPRLRAAIETAYPHEINPPRGPPENLQPGYVENPLADKQTRKQHYYEASQASPEQLEKFAARLNQQLRGHTPRDAYTLLYLLLEPLYTATLGPPGPPPGMTRAPYSHLDLAYAAATAANWYTSGEEPEGCLVAIDIASVQTFITASRRPGDHWAASWLVSALAWSTARPLIEAYGPDTLVIPSPRLNPLLLYWADGRYGLRDTLRQLYEETLPYEWPSQPIAGATTTLLLPSEACHNIEETLQSNYARSWEKVVEAATEALTQIILGEPGELTSELEQLLNWLRLYLEKIQHTPPLMLRIATVNAEEAYEKAKEIASPGDSPYRPLYHIAHLKLAEKLAEPHMRVRVAPGSTLDWLDITEPPRNTQGDPDEHAVYRLCTSCSNLPAVIRLKKTPSGRRLDLWTPGQGYTPLARKDHEEDAGTAADTLLRAGILREHEGLCPYCLTKRLLAANNTHTPQMIATLLRELVGGTGTEVGYRQYPSTSDIAMVSTKLNLLKWITNHDEEKVERLKKGLDNRKAKDLVNRLRNIITDDMHPILKKWRDAANTGNIRGLPLYTGIPRLDSEIDNHLAKIMEGGIDKLLLYSLLVATESEEALLSSEAAPIRAALADAYKPLSIRRYYMILEADGDDISSLIKGQILSLSGDVVRWGQYYEDSPPASILSNIEEMFKPYYEDGLTLLISIAYHQALSKGLMATALKDLHTIEEAYGYPVYLGGDDIKAFLPASPPHGARTPLATAAATRKNYWGKDGFNTVAGISAPAPIARGRTYTLITAHYRDPLPQLLSQANNTLKHIKAKHSEKDLLQATYTRGGLSAAAPNTSDFSRQNPEPLLSQLDELYTKIGEKYSNSLPRDLYENTRYNSEIHIIYRYHRRKEILHQYLTRILERNNPKGTNPAEDAETLLNICLSHRYNKLIKQENEHREKLGKKERTNPFFEAAKLLLILQAGER